MSLRSTGTAFNERNPVALSTSHTFWLRTPEMPRQGYRAVKTAVVPIQHVRSFEPNALGSRAIVVVGPQPVAIRVPHVTPAVAPVATPVVAGVALPFAWHVAAKSDGLIQALTLPSHTRPVLTTQATARDCESIEEGQETQPV